MLLATFSSKHFPILESSKEISKAKIIPQFVPVELDLFIRAALNSSDGGGCDI